MRIRLFVFALLSVVGLYSALVQPIHAQSGGQEIVIGKQHTIQSVVLGEERPYSVYLPVSHHDSTLAEGYPVLYVLDGEWYFPIAAGILSFSKGAFRMPESIVVAIHSKDRIKDFTPTNAHVDMWGNEILGLEASGGADAFLRFLEEELIPHIDSTYRTMPYRALVGHSFAGLFATHAYLKEGTLFNAFVLIDPSLWWDHAVLSSNVKNMLQEHHIINRAIHISTANDQGTSGTDNTPHVDAIESFWRAISSDSSPNKAYMHFDEDTHASVGVPALYRGLSFLFDGYRPADSVFTSPGLLADHFRSYSKRMGVSFLPPESLVRNLGYGKQYGEGDAKGALGFFEMNIENYPSSFHAYHVLAIAYEALGEAYKESAIHAFKKSLELEPNNTEAKEKLAALREGQE